MKKHNEAQIVDILHSISKVYLSNNELEIIFDKDTHASNIRGFQPKSFTRKLLQLIENHLKK
jgi:hypothetical protein